VLPATPLTDRASIMTLPLTVLVIVITPPVGTIFVLAVGIVLLRHCLKGAEPSVQGLIQILDLRAIEFAYIFRGDSVPVDSQFGGDAAFPIL
jgi:hypothetical protein